MHEHFCNINSTEKENDYTDNGLEETCGSVSENEHLGQSFVFARHLKPCAHLSSTFTSVQ